MDKVRRRGYVRAREVRVRTDNFSDTKGEDIRMIYNGMSSGFNDALWAPNFDIPMVASMLRSVEGRGGGTCQIGT